MPASATAGQRAVDGPRRRARADLDHARRAGEIDAARRRSSTHSSGASGVVLSTTAPCSIAPARAAAAPPTRCAPSIAREALRVGRDARDRPRRRRRARRTVPLACAISAGAVADQLDPRRRAPPGIASTTRSTSSSSAPRRSPARADHRDRRAAVADRARSRRRDRAARRRRCRLARARSEQARADPRAGARAELGRTRRIGTEQHEARAQVIEHAVPRVADRRPQRRDRRSGQRDDDLVGAGACERRSRPPSMPGTSPCVATSA